MPKLRHEAVVEVLQNEPLLVPLLLAYAGAGVRFPRRPAAVIADSNLSARDAAAGLGAAGAGAGVAERYHR
jgi:hypothetical protein